MGGVDWNSSVDVPLEKSEEVTTHTGGVDWNLALYSFSYNLGIRHHPHGWYG